MGSEDRRSFGLSRVYSNRTDGFLPPTGGREEDMGVGRHSSILSALAPKVEAAAERAAGVIT